MARALLATLLPLTACTLLVACGDDASEGESDSSGAAAPSTGDEDTTTPPTTPTTTGPTQGTSGDDASGTSGEGPTTDTTGATGTDDTTTGAPSPYDGEPLPEADDGTWTWIDFPEAKCRDGSTTGIGVRYGTAPGLVIYLEGGGACFNALTCGVNPANYGMAQFTGWAPTGGQNGIFDISNGDNPVADWSYVYVPYCTGDVHAGARTDGTLPDNPAPQQFVGYLNIGHYLQRVVPTFLGQVDHVLVTGVSAGGFGATFNYDRIADAFPGKKVTLLDDSGPSMADDYMATCLQKLWRDSWGVDDTLPADCTDCFPEDGGGIVHLGVYLGEKHKGQKLALISSLGDNTIRFFFGFGNDECTTLLPNTSEEKYTEGLYDLRDNWMSMAPGTWGTFFLGGQQHTWLGGSSYTTAESDGVLLLDWITELIAGKVSNVEP